MGHDPPDLVPLMPNHPSDRDHAASTHIGQGCGCDPMQSAALPLNYVLAMGLDQGWPRPQLQGWAHDPQPYNVLEMECDPSGSSEWTPGLFWTEKNTMSFLKGERDAEFGAANGHLCHLHGMETM